MEPSNPASHQRQVTVGCDATEGVTTKEGYDAIIVHHIMGDLRNIRTSDIKPNPVALRQVDKQGESYAGLVESIKTKGFFGAITVRQQADGTIELVDGLHRYTACVDLGIDTIPCNVTDLNDDQVLEAQIMTNIHKIETKPVEYSNQLKRILTRNPLMTENELATKLGKSPTWVKERLGLTKITNPEIQAAVDNGDMPLANAYALAKLPGDEQQAFLARAMTTPPAEFVPAATARVKELKDASRKGTYAPTEFIPTAHLRKLSDIKDAATARAIVTELIATNGVTDPVEAAQLALKWVLHLDPKAVADAKAKEEARKAAEADAKAKRAAEKAAKAAEAEKAAKALELK